MRLPSASLTREALGPDAPIVLVDLRPQALALRGAIQRRLQAVLQHGQFILGPEVAEMEQALAARVGVAHCVSCASGSEALLMALMALGIGAGDEVVTTPFTFAATAEAVVRVGARPVFADIEPDTGLIDADDVARRITPRTRALLPVSLYGQVADMTALQALADRHGLFLIEDAAQSFGARDQGRCSGSLGTVGCTSFFPSKPLGCYGDGGALFTDDEALARALREIRVHGQQGRYRHVRVGVGGRMDTLQCAVVLAKLERFDWELQRREHLARRYRDRLMPAGVAVQALRPGRQSAWAQFTVFVERREAVQAALHAQGIATAVHYPLSLNRQPAFLDEASAATTPHSHRAAQRALSLPMGPDLRETQQDRIIDALLRALREAA